MNFLISFGEGFQNIINLISENFLGLLVGLVPAVIGTLTLMTAIVKLIGEERVEKMIRKMVGGNVIFRHMIVPVLAVFFFSSPAQFLIGRYFPERNKAAYYEAVNMYSMAPLLSFFTHVNAAEAFVFLGIANGVAQAGYATAPLAAAVFLIGLFTTAFRSFVVEKVNFYLANRRDINWEEIESRKSHV